ncbi:hypothetical protein N7493_009859 [Penicillium malachiteum]|uniref:Major facilitator superfamily (MFS) profile domain-containing protein n=1 Tax=Penicillium malachiteum TaxID=1324776 RepID=A0AAD6MS47_9EURO|nr:hypothetical protein N7493_009859 [Penicillium malachiteum]
MSDTSRRSSLDDGLKDTIEHVEATDIDALDTIEQTRCSNFAWLVSITAAVGGFLFGYDIGIISAILVYLGNDLGSIINSNEKELITSITSGGAFVGSVVAGLCADRYGRKMGIYNGCVLFIIGAIIQVTSYTLAQMTVGRLVMGLGVGSAAIIVPLYITEVAPAKYRGRMISLDNLSITGGQLISYAIDAMFSACGLMAPIAVGTIIAGTNFAFTWINLLLVDRVGRRSILMHTLWVMAASLLCAAICFHWVPLNHELELTASSGDWAAYAVLACMVVYVPFYSVGAGNIAWMSSEFFPLEVRAVGTMFLTMSCWGANVIVASTFLTQMESTTPSGTFGFYAGVCFFGWIGVYFCYPEVNGMTLEDIRQVFQHGFGVKYARELQKEWKAGQMENAGIRNQV